MNFNDYFDRIVLINLERRRDRLEQCTEQFRKFGFPPVTLFEAHDMPGDGNRGCTASHRGVLELIGHHRWHRTLILEDDFEILHDDFQQRFAAMIPEVPDDWQMLYLGGHYAENPQFRVSPHVIRINQMKTTSSYAVTCEAARLMAPFIHGAIPIDELYADYNRGLRSYIFQPRLMVQADGYSDLQQHWMSNEGCMTDPHHEATV